MNRSGRSIAAAAFLLLVISGGARLEEMRYASASPTEDPKNQIITDAIPSQGPTKSGHFRGLRSADLDGDGLPELISANALTGEIHIWPGRKMEGWGEPVVLRTDADVRAFDIADLDGDARLDIVAALRGGGKDGIVIWRNLGNLRFRKVEGPGKGEVYSDIFAIDLNFDGRADLVATKEEQGAKGGIRIWVNLGTEKWQPGPAPKAEGPFHSVFVADLNQDGLLDIVAAGEGPTGGLRAWIGKDKDLKWGEPNVLAQGNFWSVSIQDLNGDDIPDILATGRETGIQVWQGLGKGAFNRMASPTAAGSFYRAAGIDRDGDGRIDIVATTMDGKGLRFWRQDPALGWVAQRFLPEAGLFRTLIVADLDGDGRLDLGAATHGEGIAVWPGFGKSLRPAPGEELAKHNLPLIPGTRMPDPPSARAEAPSAPERIPGAFPDKRLPGEYIIGAGDVLDIVIWQGLKAEVRKVQVSERGLISFGYLDNVQAAGLTVKELDDVITSQLAQFIKSPRIDVNVATFGSKVVRVMGSVARPQTYSMARTITMLDSILLAGGHLTATADRPGGDLARVTLQREGRTRSVNLLRFISGGTGEAENPILQDGDLVFVPETSAELVEQKRVFVFGDAKTPGVYPLTFNMRVLDAVAKGGGFTEFALRDEIRIIRGDPERPEIILADLKAMLQRGDRRGNHLLRPNDVVYIPRSIIGDLQEFVKQVTPILEFLLFPARFRDVYALNTNVLKFDVGGPSAAKAAQESEGTFTPGATVVQVR